MYSTNKNKTLHIVMYPWFALSHLTSSLRLANKLADRGHRITFFLPSNTQPKLSPHNHHPHLITFVPFAVPFVDGLPSGAQTTNDVPASARPLIATAMDLTKDMMDSCLAQLRPDHVLFDFAYWIPELAHKYGAKSMYYATSNLVRYAYLSSRARNIPDDELFSETELIHPPPGFPCPGMRMRAIEARTLARVGQIQFGKGVKLMKRLNISFRDCDAIVSKTCREIEGPYIEFLEKHLDKPILLAGPMIPDPPSSKLETQIETWLNGFSKGSVVYCALGSECVLSKELLHQLVLGLELTEKPFLAALKPPTGYEKIESALPKGFLERTKGKGIVHGGWVQQPLILQHPSVGCFVTHCGAGSIAEAILSECQLVLLPQAVDQFINARFMTIDLKIGVEVDKRSEDDDFFTKEDVCKAIMMVMQVEGEVGKMVKTNHAKWRQVLLKEGLEDSYIDEFIQGLQGLLK